MQPVFVDTGPNIDVLLWINPIYSAFSRSAFHLFRPYQQNADSFFMWPNVTVWAGFWLRTGQLGNRGSLSGRCKGHVFSKQPTLAQGGCVTGAKATKVCRRPLTSTRWLAQEWMELWHYSLTRLRGLYKQSLTFIFILCGPNGTSFCDNTWPQKSVLIK